MFLLFQELTFSNSSSTYFLLMRLMFLRCICNLHSCIIILFIFPLIYTYLFSRWCRTIIVLHFFFIDFLRKVHDFFFYSMIFIYYLCYCFFCFSALRKKMNQFLFYNFINFLTKHRLTMKVKLLPTYLMK